MNTTTLAWLGEPPQIAADLSAMNLAGFKLIDCMAEYQAKDERSGRTITIRLRNSGWLIMDAAEIIGRGTGQLPLWVRP